jgi:hypothetical protein
VTFVARSAATRRTPHGGGDKLFDTKDFVAEMSRLGVTPHVAQHTNGRRSAIDRRTTYHAGYAVSQRICKRIEEGFGRIKTVGGLRKPVIATRHWMDVHADDGRRQSRACPQAADAT